MQFANRNKPSLIVHSLALSALFGLSPTSHASTTICRGDDKPGGIKAVAWDSKTKTAKLSYLNEQLQGRLTLTRAHNSGFKVNIIVEHAKPHFGADVTEYIVFSMPTAGDYRLLWVTYVLREGERHLEFAAPSEPVTCETL